jgi:hypothetical protein
MGREDPIGAAFHRGLPAFPLPRTRVALE